MPQQPFNLNEDGNVIIFPLTGWVITTAMESAVLLRLEYAETPAALKMGDLSALQLIANPQQTLDLAISLTKTARRILDAPLPPGPRS